MAFTQGPMCGADAAAFLELLGLAGEEVEVEQLRRAGHQDVDHDGREHEHDEGGDAHQHAGGDAVLPVDAAHVRRHIEVSHVSPPPYAR